MKVAKTPAWVLLKSKPDLESCKMQLQSVEAIWTPYIWTIYELHIMERLTGFDESLAVVHEEGTVALLRKWMEFKM